MLLVGRTHGLELGQDHVVHQVRIVFDQFLKTLDFTHQVLKLRQSLVEEDIFVRIGLQQTPMQHFFL